MKSLIISLFILLAMSTTAYSQVTGVYQSKNGQVAYMTMVEPYTIFKFGDGQPIMLTVNAITGDYFVYNFQSGNIHLSIDTQTITLNQYKPEKSFVFYLKNYITGAMPSTGNNTQQSFDALLNNYMNAATSSMGYNLQQTFDSFFNAYNNVMSIPTVDIQQIINNVNTSTPPIVYENYTPTSSGRSRYMIENDLQNARSQLMNMERNKANCGSAVLEMQYNRMIVEMKQRITQLETELIYAK